MADPTDCIFFHRFCLGQVSMAAAGCLHGTLLCSHIRGHEVISAPLWPPSLYVDDVKASWASYKQLKKSNKLLTG